MIGYNTHQALWVGPMMGQSLASVVDAGTTLRQRWSINLSCWLDIKHDIKHDISVNVTLPMLNLL